MMKFDVTGLFIFFGCVIIALAIVMTSSSVQPSYVAGGSLELTEPTDDTTGALLTVDYAHHEVHSGSHYFYKDYYTIAKNGVKQFAIVTPNTTKWAHFTYDIDAVSSSVTIQIFEAPTVNTIGTSEPVRNRNRNYNDTPTTLLYEDTTVTADGIEIKATTVGAGKNSEGGASRDDQEIVLKQGTTYLIRITEGNIASTMINFKVDWYEHTNKI